MRGARSQGSSWSARQTLSAFVAVVAVAAFEIVQIQQASRFRGGFAFRIVAADFQYVSVVGCAMLLASVSPSVGLALPAIYCGVGLWFPHLVASAGIIGQWPTSAGAARLLGLVCAIAPVVAYVATRPPAPPRESESASEHLSGINVFSVGLLIAASVLILARLRSALSGEALFTGLDQYMLACAAGFAVSARRRFWLIPASLLVLLAVPDIQVWVASGGRTSIPAISVFVPLFLVILSGSWRSISGWLGDLSDRTSYLLVAANLLNILDAALTWLAVKSGGGSELNPLLGVGGLGAGLAAKVVGVLVVTALIAKLAPRFLIIPVAALLAVCIWHMAGLAINRGL